MVPELCKQLLPLGGYNCKTGDLLTGAEDTELSQSLSQLSFATPLQGRLQ